MIGWGKIIAAMLGYMLMRPLGSLMGLIGLFLGLYFGHRFDMAYRHLSAFGSPNAEHARIQAIFFSTTFQVMGYIAKSDGHVSESEIRMARQVMDKMRLSDAQRQDAIRYFTQGKESQFNLDQALFLLRQNCRQQPILLHMFVEIQFQAAHADGPLTPNKEHSLHHICEILGTRVNFGNFFYGAGSQRGYQHAHQHRPSSASRLAEAYELLGVSAATNDADIKRAYRRQMSQNHPDKLVAKGLPDAMLKLATEKTQKIQAAYEQICAARS